MSLFPGLSFVRKEKHMTKEEIKREDDAWKVYWEEVDKNNKVKQNGRKRV